MEGLAAAVTRRRDGRVAHSGGRHDPDDGSEGTSGCRLTTYASRTDFAAEESKYREG